MSLGGDSAGIGSDVTRRASIGGRGSIFWAKTDGLGSSTICDRGTRMCTIYQMSVGFENVLPGKYYYATDELP